MKMRIYGLVRDGEWFIAAYYKERGRWVRYGVQRSRTGPTAFEFPERVKKLNKFLARNGFDVIWEDRIDPDGSKVEDDYLELLGFERLGKGDGVGDVGAIDAVLARHEHARKLLHYCS